MFIDFLSHKVRLLNVVELLLVFQVMDAFQIFYFLFGINQLLLVLDLLQFLFAGVHLL